MQDHRCPFCNVESERLILLETQLSFCIYDNFPVSKGHCLIIPKRHSSHYFELTAAEKVDIWILVDSMVPQLLEKHHPDGFNVGFNSGQAAGQTVFHTHIHIIPRYVNDCDDPAGGIRHVLPGKGKYK